MKKSKKKQQLAEEVPNFSQVFDSMEDELLVEMALYYPQQLRDLCLFLTLDHQLAKEELEHTAVAYSN